MMDIGTPGKRKRAIDDAGDRDHKKVHADSRELTIEQLHQDVGEKYMLCQTKYDRPSFRTADDLFKEFGLTTIASKVARTDEKGEKRALRKSYKAQIKSLKLSGHFEPEKKEADDPGSLMAMIMCPEPEWIVHEVKGKEVDAGLSKSSKDALLRSMTMNKGNIPPSIWDASVLGDLGKSSSTKSLPGRETAPGTPLHTPGAGAVRPLGASSKIVDPNRPKKGIKKRSLGDSGFEGYGETFPDDDMGVETGYSTAEGDERAPAQKRRKKNVAAPSPYPSVRQPAFGSGMLGV